MLTQPPEQSVTGFEKDYEAIVEKLDGDEVVTRHREELFAVWYASSFIRRVCVSQPLWLQGLLVDGGLHVNREREGYVELLQAVFSKAGSVEELQQSLRRLRVAEFARIAWRDLQQYATVRQTLHELSTCAEVCIDGALSWCFDWLQSRPHTGEFERSLPRAITVFALGKLGGGELNFSSDVDLVFAYADSALTDGGLGDRQDEAASFYVKLVQLFIKLLSHQTQDGFAFRVDTRLRPFGNAGTLVPSLAAVDQYFQTHGRDWERYVWIKARTIAGDVRAGERFLEEQVTPFVYRRYLDYGAMHSLREMKALIDQKARKSAAQTNVKIGEGGIREIEFIAQMFQLIYGSKDMNLRTRSTLDSLKYLGGSGMLSQENVIDLAPAYLFLRKAENGLQMRDDQQIYTLPTQGQAREQYAYLLGMGSWEKFHAEYVLHTDGVNKVFQSLLQTDAVDDDEAAVKDDDFASLWGQIEDEGHCTGILTRYFVGTADDVGTEGVVGGDEVGKIYRRLREFSQSGVVQQLVPVSRQRLDDFIPVLLRYTSKMERPFLVLDRFLGILEKIVQRSTYISLLIENQNKLKTLFKLVETSQWVAQYISIYPLLLDEILRVDESYEPPDLFEMRQQLKTVTQSIGDDLEKYMERLREFKHAQVIQIAAADILQNFPVMRVSDHLSWLADACIDSAVRRAYQDLVARHGAPSCVKDGEEFVPELLVVEYGKLGGLELGYGSDLDVVFLHNSEGECGETDGEKKIPNEVFFTRLVQRTLHLLTTVSAAGKIFDIDVRLRPYGTSGPIVCALTAYEGYLRNEAWLWEHQALIRARPVATDPRLADDFTAIRKAVLCRPREIEEVRRKIIEMRQKIIDELGSKKSTDFNIKKDAGGIVDIEFIVQFHVLAYANKHSELCRFTDNVRILDACVEAGLLDRKCAGDLKEIYLGYRRHLHQLNLKLLPAVVEADRFAKERAAIQHYWSSLLH